MKKLCSMLLVLMLILGCCLPAFAQETRAVDWDLTDIYADDAAFEAGCAKVTEIIDAVAAFRGKLNTVENVVALYEACDAFQMEYYRLSSYVGLLVDIDVSNGDAQALMGRVYSLYYDYAEASAFITPELFANDDAFLDSLENDARMAPYLLDFTRSRRNQAHMLSEKEENLLLPLDRLTGNASTLFSKLVNSELPFKDIVFPDGVTRKADESNQIFALMGGFDQSFRKEYTMAMMSAYEAFRDTLAQNYENYCIGVSANAHAHGYESALEADLSSVDMKPELYDALIESSLKGTGLITRYAELMKKELKLDEIYSFDMNLPIAQAPDISYTYDEACETVLAALAPLGEKYVADARTALAGGWVDVYSADGKPSGAYSMCVMGVHPYILLNFDGTYKSVSTLAHELGHTMHQWYSDQGQDTYYTSNPSTMITEVASTFNELLLNDYMIKNAQTDEERKYYIAQELRTLYSTFFTQCMFANFQQASMEAVENGETLTADHLGEIWLESCSHYLGDTVKTVENYSVGWSRISHFYQGFYVYNYALAISASSDIASRVTAGDEGALEGYLTYLSAGDSCSTEETLAIAGIDASNGDFIGRLLARFESLMDAYESI